jgi:collagenase-like PrtC family protease
MLELLSPAGSPEGVVAAVQNGADAVYMGFGDFNARRNAKNFSEEEFSKAAEYCRVRGVKTYVTLNTLVSDRNCQEPLSRRKSPAGSAPTRFSYRTWGFCWLCASPFRTFPFMPARK